MNIPDSKPSKTSEIEFHLIKSSLFRTIHCDGFIGSTGPDGKIHLAIFSERFAIPKKMVVRANDGELGDEIEEKREGKSGIVRDVEANVVLDLDTAISLYEWIHNRLEEAVQENLIEKIEDGEEKYG